MNFLNTDKLKVFTKTGQNKSLFEVEIVAEKIYHCTAECTFQMNNNNSIVY